MRTAKPGSGNLVLRDSIPHFPLNCGCIVWLIGGNQRRALPRFHFLEWVSNPQKIAVSYTLVPLRDDWPHIPKQLDLNRL